MSVKLSKEDTGVESKTLRRNIFKAILPLVSNCLPETTIDFKSAIDKHKHINRESFNEKCQCRQELKQCLLPENLHVIIQKLILKFDQTNQADKGSRDTSFINSEACLDSLDCMLYCDGLFWFYTLQWENKSLQEFLNENKHQIFHMLEGSQKCCLCQLTNNIKPAKTITPKHWEQLFMNLSDGCSFQCCNLICASKSTARPNLSVSLLYKMDITLPKLLLELFCPLKQHLMEIITPEKQILMKNLTPKLKSLLSLIKKYTCDNENDTEDKDVQQTESPKPYTHVTRNSKTRSKYPVSIFPSQNTVHNKEITTFPGGMYFTSPQQRLASFCNWPFHKRYWPSPLAEAGFVYTGQKMILKCFMCDITTSVEKWVLPEKPSEAHARLNPTCKYVIDMGFKEHTFSQIEKSDTLDIASVGDKTDLNCVSKINSRKDNILDNTIVQCEDKNQSYNVPKLIKVPTELENKYTDAVFASDNVFTPDMLAFNTSNRNYHAQTISHLDQLTISNNSNNYTSTDGMNDMLQCSQANVETDSLSVVNEVATNHEANVETRIQPKVGNGNSSNHFHFDTVLGDINLKNENEEIHQTTDAKQIELASQHVYGPVVRFKYPQLQTYDSRLESFKKWKYSAKQRPIDLATAGYFYTGEGDIVRCFCCDLGLAEWDENDNVWVEHARHSSNCWFLKQEKGEAFVNDIQQKWKKIYNPKHPVFEDKALRLSTFTDSWRSDIEQTPEILVDAGFFYTGEEDVVRCHYCDGGLRNWENGDIPWDEHARWFPFCKFVIKMKGKEYIEEIRQKIELKERGEQILNQFEDSFVDHPFLKQLEDLSFAQEDIIFAMRDFTRIEGHFNFDLEDLIEIIINRNTSNQITKEQSKSKTDISNTENESEAVKDAKTLKEINRQLKESLLCVLCKSNDISMLFTNCGHRITCENCAKSLLKCPYCNKKIRRCIKTFLA